MEKKDRNELQVNAWRVIEALTERQYDLASGEELAEAVGITVPQCRRILLTWEELGIVEARGTMWRLTEVLAETIPHKLRLALREKFVRMETPPYIPQKKSNAERQIQKSAAEIGLKIAGEFLKEK